jgi:hydrogenase nickel incorporation protein HypA/HybF
MHELSIVMSVVDIANDEVKKHHAHGVEAIELEIGTMAGVEFDALEFAWEAGVRNTILESSKKIINRVQAHARCPDCDTEFLVDEPFAPCPVCNNVLLEYLTGKELRVKSLTVV